MSLLEQTWHQAPIVVLDVETTGIDPRNDGVVELAAVRFEGGDVVSRFGTYVNPGRPIPAAATAVHGITDAKVEGAPTLHQALCSMVAEGVLDGAWPCAYNATFVQGFIRAAGYEDLAIPALDPGAHWIDPLVPVRHFDRYVKGGHHLVRACSRYDIQIESAHRATDDAEAAGRLLYALRPKLGDMSLGLLIERMLVRSKEQRERLDKYHARKGSS